MSVCVCGLVRCLLVGTDVDDISSLMNQLLFSLLFAIFA